MNNPVNKKLYILGIIQGLNPSTIGFSKGISFRTTKRKIFHWKMMEIIVVIIITAKVIKIFISLFKTN